MHVLRWQAQCLMPRWRLACSTVLAALVAAPVVAAEKAEDAATAAAAAFNRSTYSSPIALSADDRLVWSVNPADDSVSVLRTDTNAVLRRIPVGDEPQSVAVDPTNTFAFVANAAAGSVTVIKINNATFAGFNAVVEKTIRTGAEPWNIVISPDGRRVFVANSSQDTLTVINAVTRTLIGQVNLRNSLCNDPIRQRHFQPRGLAVSQNNTRLLVTRFLSFVGPPPDRQAADVGKEGAVCILTINTAAAAIGGYVPSRVVRLAARPSGFKIDSTGDGTPDNTQAFPNQLQSVVIRGNRAFLPNIAASPKGPLQFQNSTQAYLNFINNVNGAGPADGGALNLNLGARNPEAGKKTLFFANQWGIAFTTQSGPGKAYAVSAGSDLLVKLNVSAADQASFTVDGDTTRYIDLNDPANPATRGNNAGKNPQGIAINSTGTRAYVANFVSRNVSVVNLATDQVITAVRTQALPSPGSRGEQVLVGAEMFFSTRGHFDDPGLAVSTDERLSGNGWQGCASCHFKGLTDGVVWAFASGPRKSVNLAGSFDPRNRARQRIFNYSGIFSVVQDFEANIRNISGPGPLPAPQPCSAPPPPTSANDPNHGLLLGDVNKNQAPCVINGFVKSNENRSQVTVTLPGSGVHVKALDALKAWVQDAVRVPNGPLTSAEIAGGVPAGEIAQGRALFQGACASCHGGGLWSRSIRDFTPPVAANQITCEVNLGAAAPPGSACTTAPAFGNPTPVQFLTRFLRDVGSFNLGVAGGPNPLGTNIGGPEFAAPVLVGGVSQAPADALGRDYNGDGKGIGYTVQSLLGTHNVQPYLHNGACETIACVVGHRPHRTANGQRPDPLPDPGDQALVARFVESIDRDTQPFP